MSSRAANRDVEHEPLHIAGVREMPAWLVSLVVHAVLLLLLGSMVRVSIVEPEHALSSVIEDLPSDEYQFRNVTVEDLGSDGNVNVLGPSRQAATQVAPDPQKKTEQRLEERNLTVNVPQTDLVEKPNESEFADVVDTVGQTVHTGGVAGAIDRLTWEIAASLKERKTLVVWLFDASLSLKARRKQIAGRFANVYRQLGVIAKDRQRYLKTAVVSFGRETHLLTPKPVDDVSTLVEAVRNIKPDVSGTENVFSAVDLVTRKWKTYRTKMRRNIMVIIVTDERGDDDAGMEEVITRARRYGIRVYCVGNAAPFGRIKGKYTWKYADGTEEDLDVDQGPESVLPERIRLAFWGPSPPELKRISSGFGPYALTRLCAETGGIYLVAAEPPGGLRFDPAVMKAYHPDYRPKRLYQKSLAKNRARSALVQAAMLTAVDEVRMPQMTFPAETDNILRQVATEAQKPMAVLDAKLRTIYGVLQTGEKDRSKLTSPRWRAGYDLAMGRVLATLVRAYGYNKILAEMKSAPRSFKKKGSNTWRLIPSRKITTGPSVKKYAKQAAKYLNRVIDEHPGTPWARLAEQELSQPLGWDWRELTQARRSRRGPDGKRILLAEDAKKKREMKRKADARKRNRPKL